MYTYIFKISQETNGTTGTGNDPTGLFPITFDAAVIAETEAQQGTETIINTPSITTYQEGSVTTNGIEYKTGTAIDITVKDNSTNNNESLNTISDTKGCLKVFQFTTQIDEATLQVSGTTGGTELSSNTTPILTVNTDKATFIPSSAGYYAIQYCYKVESGTPVYKYKVIEVKSSGN